VVCLSLFLCAAVVKIFRIRPTRAVGALIALVGALALGWLHGGGRDLPAFETVRDGWRPSAGYLLDRHGDVIHVRRLDHRVQRRPWISLDQVSPSLVQAVLAAEDRRFYSHGGVDWRALARAGLAYVQGEPAGGASTLTMQLVSLLDGTAGRGGRSPLQKLEQMRAAIVLERDWTKEQIVETYLNLVSLRGELQGAPAATQALFGKSPEGLGEGESVLLAAILPSPNAPVAAVAARGCRIARAAGFHAACADLEAFGREALSRAGRPALEPALAPHLATALLRDPGARVASTLDAGIQRLALEALRRQLIDLSGSGVRDGAAVVLHNATGEVLAYVGSAGPASRAREVDGVAALRQAGSTLKPFLYGLAIERGYVTAASLLEDSPVQVDTGVGLYVPQNYDRDFKGTVSVRTALASSLNVPAVRLLMLAGVEPLRDRLRDFGYRSLGQPGEHYGYSLALGSADVSLLDQANAYRALANGGVWSAVRLRPDEPAGASRRALSAAASHIVSDILADAAARAPTFGLDGPLATGYWAAVKTGTSKNLRDNWCLGYSRDYTVGVWVGNFEGDAMRDVSGTSGAAPAWREIMDALQARPVGPPAAPPDVVAVPVRFEPPVEPARTEWFVTGTETGLVQLAGAVGRPRIAAPPDGVIVALDPDIPTGNQRLVFVADGVDRLPAAWVLDGEPIGPADEPVVWAPVPGRHHLALRADGRELDAVSFRVRGVPRPRLSAAD
jgi:penicillin-binding protein 1C